MIYIKLLMFDSVYESMYKLLLMRITTRIAL